ncbi:Polyubiquitin (Fragment) [Seminavis robusta]|uniref:Polyubiquitin n=1 Tax=Seminavis robusta TaxID=568900 RepID=A0A9N8DBX0_9STRA
MAPSDSMDFVKEKVAPEAGIEPERQVLSFDGNNLSGNETADDVGLKDGSVIDLAPNTITVHVKNPDGTKVSVTMDPSKNVQSIKESIAPAVAMDPSEQILSFNGNPLLDDASADTAGLVDGSVIDLETKEPDDTINVLVKTPDGKTIPVKMKVSDTIESIKKQVSGESGIDVPQQVLKFEGKKLKDGETGEDAGLANGSVLHLDVNKAVSKKEAKKKKMAKLKQKAEGAWIEEKPKEYKYDFNPTPFDLTRFRAHFMVGDQVPMEMICPHDWNVKNFKVEILKLKNDTRFVKKYFAEMDNPDGLDIYAPGSDGEGDPLPDDIPVPRTSSPYAFFSVIRKSGY